MNKIILRDEVAALSSRSPPSADTMQGWVTRNSIPSGARGAGDRNGRAADRAPRGAAAEGNDVMRWSSDLTLMAFAVAFAALLVVFLFLELVR